MPSPSAVACAKNSGTRGAPVGAPFFADLFFIFFIFFMFLWFFYVVVAIDGAVAVAAVVGLMPLAEHGKGKPAS